MVVFTGEALGSSRPIRLRCCSPEVRGRRGSPICLRCCSPGFKLRPVFVSAGWYSFFRGRRFFSPKEASLLFIPQSRRLVLLASSAVTRNSPAEGESCDNKTATEAKDNKIVEILQRIEVLEKTIEANHANREDWEAQCDKLKEEKIAHVVRD